MINIKASGQIPHMPLSAGCTRVTPPSNTSHYSSTLASLDAMLHAPVQGAAAAFSARRKIAYCHSDNFWDDPEVLEPLTPVPVTYKRNRKIDAGLKIASELGFVTP